jgi:thiol:disulfide interchange protein DsbD
VDRRRYFARLRRVLAVAALAGPALVAAASLGGEAASGSGNADLLPAEEAFVLAAERQADGTIVLDWTIAPDSYLYRDRSELALVDAGGASLGEPDFAPAKEKQDPFFGQVAVYYEQARVRVPIEGQPGPDATLKVTYQGCNEPVGVCYPPIERRLALDSIAVADDGAASTPASGDGNATGGQASRQQQIAQALDRWSTAWTLAAFFGFGVLLALTPCVFPMLPILAGIIAGERHRTHARRGTGLALVFVTTMALTYAVAGVVVGVTGASMQAWFQQPWVLALFAALFGVLAASMFGLFDLQIPAVLRARLEGQTRRLGGTVAGAAALGPISAVVVGPCVTPPLIGALLFIAEAGEPITGGLALFALGLGMGLPLVVFGTAAGHLLPRAGPWMTTVRAAFGFLLLALAVWLIQRVVPVPVAMVLWSVLLIVAGVQMGALAGATGPWQRLWKGLGTVLVLYGAILLVGAASGGDSVLQPLRGVVAADSADPTQPAFKSVADERELRQALAQASAQDRPVMLEVYADWCVSCQELERFTFPDAKVRQALGDTLLLRADVTANDADHQALLGRFDLYGPPAVLFFGPDGVERRGHRLVGFKGPEAFARHVRRALPEAAS